MKSVNFSRSNVSFCC